MDAEDESDFSRMLRDTLAQTRPSAVKATSANDGASSSKNLDVKTLQSPFEQQMYQVLARNNIKPPPSPKPSTQETQPETRKDIVELMQSLGIDLSEASAAGLRNAENRRREKEENGKTAEENREDESEIEHYHNFLCEVSTLGTVECVLQTAIKKEARKPYGTGASMTVYPGLWEAKKEDGSMSKKVVAIKYCNITPPQGASSLRDCKNQISSRLTSVLYELEVMSGRDNRHGNAFPEVYAMSWEECQTPAGITIYQPILVVEPAVATLEEYICNGWPHSAVRHEAEQRFIMSIHSAISYLHEHCGIVHGDLKPANILVFLNQYSGEVHAKLADFGLAFPIFEKKIERKRPDDMRPVGTPYWSAPEMCLVERFIFRSALNPYVADYYSFALVVWFILCGYPVSASGKRITKDDEENFNVMKGKWGTEVQDHFEEAFNRRWRWKVKDSYVKYLKKEKDASKRKKLLSALTAVRQIEEQEWDERTQKWISTKSQLHHAYRGLVRTALSWMGDKRIYPVALPTSIIFERSVAQTLAACHICGELEYPLFDYKFSADAARRHVEKRLGSDLYARHTSEEANKAKSKVLFIGHRALNAIPQSLGQELMKLLVPRASDERRTEAERIRDMNSIDNLSIRFISNVDSEQLERQKLELGASVHRLRDILNQSLREEVVDRKLEIAWILDGLSSFLTEEVDDKVKGALNTISHNLAEKPAQIALTDWASEVGRRENKQPTFGNLDKHPVFQSVFHGNLPELQHHLAKTKTRPSKLRYEQYNLLNFAIVNNQPKICRYLCLEHDFEPSFEDGGEEAFEAVISDSLSTVLTEFDSFSALVHKKWLSETGGDIDKKPANLGLQLLFPPSLAILVQRGTAMAIEYTHSLVSSPLAINAKMTQMMWIDQFEGDDAINPLLSALATRRFTPFLRVLQMGGPDHYTFSPNSIVFGSPILFHAIESLAPFFVAALLAYGADAKATVHILGMNLSPLHMVCTPRCGQGYKESLQRRLEFHEECGFDKRIIKRDRAEIEVAEPDAVSQRILIADLLLSHGADINALSVGELGTGLAAQTVAADSETHLSLAIGSGNTDLACFLIKKGANLTIPSMGKTPLYQAIDHDNGVVIKCLLEQGASVDELCNGIPPLGYTTCLARHDTFRLLLEAGANLTFAPATGGILFYQILEMSSELWSDEEAAVINSLSTREERLKLRPILAEHLKKTPPAHLKALMQTKAENDAIAIHHAARWITGRNEGDSELLMIILTNTEDLHATVKTGQNALVLGLALGNQGFVQAWNLAFGMRMFGL